MHVKIHGSVAYLSQVFNTTFIEYKCPDDRLCFATNSDVSIPINLKSAIIGVLGVEQILQSKPNYVIGKKIEDLIGYKRQLQSFPYFLGPQASQVYGFPTSNGAGIGVGIISLGGYFTQSDLDKYFTRYSLGLAPTINIVYIDGATQNLAGSADENYLDVEIIASVVPQAKITLYFAPNTNQGFYDCLYAAITQNNIVSVSWGYNENSILSSKSFLDSFQALFSKFSNVPVFIATGDDGSSTGVGFPASCPNAIGKNI